MTLFSHHRLVLLLSLWVGLSMTAPQGCGIETPTVDVRNGTYAGLFNPTYNQDLFLGMPFAQPPVGELRLQNPAPLNESWTGTRNATQYSPECIGFGSDDWVLGNIVSEDCLAINVVRPAGTNPGAGLPVAFWMYGGGGYEGGSLDPRYNLSFIVQQGVLAEKPFIAVSINYRVQAFGFLFGTTIKEAGVSNLGFKDQRQALYWVQENIAAFGGDPAKVTIWGESAGASSVGQQMLAYGGRDEGLFRGAIMESGGPVGTNSFLSAAEWDPYYNNITAAVNCSSASDTLACLRAVPIDTLTKVFNSSVTAQAPAWGAQIDGDWLRNASAAMMVAGQIVKVPILHGRNHDEGSMFATKGINTTEQFLATVRSAGLDNETANTIAALYPDIPAVGIPSTLEGRPTGEYAYLGNQWKREAAYAGDMRQHAPRRLISQTWAGFNVSSWSYHWDVLVNGQPAEIGATHFQEVAFVFHNIQGLGYNNSVAQPPFEGKPQSYRQLSTIMSRMWASFIVDLDPNYSGATDVHWPVYTTDNPQNIYFNANITNLCAPEPDYYRAAGIAYIQERLVSVYGH